MPKRSPTAHRVEWPQVLAFRLRRHHLAGAGHADAATICRDACGMQAQVFSAAYLGLWARNHRLTRATIDAALWQKRTLVKTSAMRGTLHLLAAGDYPVYIAALREGRLRFMRKIMARYGASAREADAVRDLFVDALGAGPAARHELTATVLSRATLSKKARKWFEQSWWGVVRQAIVEGTVCYGPDRNGEVILVRTDRWLPRLRKVDQRKAKQELLRRYLRAYGPATPGDFARWAGESVADARPTWESLRGEMMEVTIESHRAALLRKDWKELAGSRLRQPSVRLLPNFDSYLLGHVSKRHLVEDRLYARVYRRAGWISPVVLLDGRVAGVWSQSLRAKRMRIEIELFRKIPTAVRGLVEEEAAGVAGFLESPFEIAFRK